MDHKNPYFPPPFPVVICFTACIFWIALTPKGEEAAVLAESKTRTHLTLAEQHIDKFRRSWKTTPKSMAELRAFAQAEQSDFVSFDGFGNRMDYLRLSDEHFFLRSFGADNRQNSQFTDNDQSIVRLPEIPFSTPRYKFLVEENLALYPSPTILGIHAPNQKWYAEIFSDQQGGSRRLVVRSTTTNKFLSAPHDLVEEFLWLPNSHQIVFSATSSLRYRDGIYLWNILTDEVSNLISSIGDTSQLRVTNKESRYYLSLAGVKVSGEHILAYIAPASDVILNPRAFLSGLQLYEIKLPGPGTGPTVTSVDGLDDISALDHQLDVGRYFYGAKEDDEIFKSWLGLSTSGNIEAVIAEWQKFSEEYAESPILPYCLWLLASIYNDAFRLLKDEFPKDAAVLRSYGAELSDALAQLPSAPSYLRGFGAFIYESLMAEEPLPYKISQLSMPTKKDVASP